MMNRVVEFRVVVWYLIGWQWLRMEVADEGDVGDDSGCGWRKQLEMRPSRLTRSGLLAAMMDSRWWSSYHDVKAPRSN